MRWFLVLLILYIIPLIILFKNYNNLKRSCIYASSYIVAMSTIVITNIYISGLNEIEETMYYNRNLFNNTNISQNINIDDEVKLDIDETKSIEEAKEVYKEEVPEEIPQSKNDLDILEEFKKEIYTIEEKALMPMRDCMVYTDDITKSLSKLDEIRIDVENAYNKCVEASYIYEDMAVENMSKGEYTEVLETAKTDVKIAYELRAKAMENSLNLIDTKNPIYIGKITEYMNLSDEYISSFKDRLKVLKLELEDL